jgi:dihydropteroate synthase
MSEPPTRSLDCRGRRLVLGGRTLVVGILNATPDSFYDGGRHAGAEAAFEHAARLVGEGADAIDLGGQSTRPGERPEIPVSEEIDRILPVLRRLVADLPVPISIDAHRPEVARAALEDGAHLVNDVRGFQGDPGMAAVVAEFGCPVVLMHWDPGFSGGTGDRIERIRAYFSRSLGIAKAAGIGPERIILDPGIGFSKTAEESLEIMGRLDELRQIGFPVMLGASRKSSIGQVLGVPAEERLEGTLATTALAVAQGVEFVRVHDVRANVRAARVAEAILARRPGPLGR